MRKMTSREKALNYRFDDLYITAYNNEKTETIKLSNDNILGGDIHLMCNDDIETITPVFVLVDTSKPLFQIRNIEKVEINIDDIKYNISYSINNVLYHSLFDDIIKLYPSNKITNRSLDLILIPTSEKTIV